MIGVVTDNMVINRLVSDYLFSNMYVIVQDNHAVIIDPFKTNVLDDSLIIDKIILTHEHYDHISGVNFWKKKNNVPVLCSKVCSERICNSKRNIATYFKEFCEFQTLFLIDSIPQIDSNYMCYADEVFENILEFTWQNHIFKLFELPGHSLGSIGILLDNKHFFSGDSLLIFNDTEIIMPSENKRKWKES